MRRHLDHLRERLAAIEHTRWAAWQRYVHQQCTRNDDGSLTIPAEAAAFWQRRIEMPYTELSEQEKATVRRQVERYLPLIEDDLYRQQIRIRQGRPPLLA